MALSENAMAAVKNGKNGKNAELLTAVSKRGNLKGANSNTIALVMEQYKDQIARVLPRHLTAEKMIQISTTVIARNPQLMECNLPSVIGCVIGASMLGLDLNPQFGQAYPVPYFNKNSGQKEAQLIVGYKGYVQLARNTGELSTIYAELVHENDQFNYQLGLNPDLTHVPADGDRGKMTRVYAVAKYKDGGFNFVVLTKDEVEKYRKRSKSPNKGPWVDDYGPMCKKTAIRRLKDYMPMSPDKDFAKALAVDGNTVQLGNIKQDGIDLMDVPDVPYEDVTGEAEINEEPDTNGQIGPDEEAPEGLPELLELHEELEDVLDNKIKGEWQEWRVSDSANNPAKIKEWRTALLTVKNAKK